MVICFCSAAGKSVFGCAGGRYAEMEMMAINTTIVGAGNIGTQFAAHCAEAGHRVTVFGSKPEKINPVLTVVDENNCTIHQGAVANATADAKEAFQAADLIFVTMPAPLMKANAEKIQPYARPGMIICLIPGTGGGECAFKGCVDKGATVFGLQRVPSVARLTEYGKTVRCVGYRGELMGAAIPHGETEKCCRLIESIFGIPTLSLPNYLNITLTPSNPILHTTRLRNIFGDYRVGKVYDRIPLFYEDWTDASSRLLLACDDEVQSICKAITEFDLSYVKSLRLHYESPTAEAMTRKISGIAGFRGLESPKLAVEGGFVPDFGSRYFTADFPYGLAILLQLARFAELDVPNMQGTYDWYQSVVGPQVQFSFADYGIRTREDLISFYSK